MGNPNLEFSMGKILLLDKYRFLNPRHLREIMQSVKTLTAVRNSPASKKMLDAH